MLAHLLDIEKPEYDPERALWMPSRRKFFLLGLAAGVAPFLPDVPVTPTASMACLGLRVDYIPSQAIHRHMFGVAATQITAAYMDGKLLKANWPIMLKEPYIGSVYVDREGNFSISDPAVTPLPRA